MGNNISNNIRNNAFMQPYSYPNITFEVASKEKAHGLLHYAEGTDSYLEKCYASKLNAIARRKCEYTPNTVTVHEQNQINNFLKDINRWRIPLRLRGDLKHINIVILMPSADGGMPHTRPGNVICLPQLSLIENTTTLIHELWHIHQRTYKDMWNSVFSELGWRIYRGKIPELNEHHRRYNPDTIDEPLWCYNNTWVPVPTFLNSTKPSLTDADVWFYNIENETFQKEIPPELAIEYPVNLPKIAYEHPREITAYIMAEHANYPGAPILAKLKRLLGDACFKLEPISMNDMYSK